MLCVTSGTAGQDERWRSASPRSPGSGGVPVSVSHWAIWEVLLESRTGSSVSLTLRERLLSLHQISDSSSLVKSWSAAASSADLMTWSLWCVMMGGRGAQGTATSLRTEGDDVTRIYPLGTMNVCSKFYCNLILRYFSMVNWSTDKYL